MKPARSPESHRSILKVLVGSHAHGLAGHESDQDFRSVFVIPTKAMFRVGFKYQGARMMKEGEDETAWEIGQFLFLAQQGHPLVLETFMAPVVETDTWGAELRDLFPSLWSARNAYESFLTYCENQRKKMLEKKDGRPAKYAAAYVRVLFNLCELLERGTFSIRIAETPVGDAVRKIKDGEYRVGEVIDLGEYWTEQATRRLSACPQSARPDLADAFLINLRKGFLR
jgi:predicted nucleotidyltransferase